VYFKDTAFIFHKDLLDCIPKKYTKVVSNFTQNISIFFQKCDLKWAVGLLTWNTEGVLREINYSDGKTGRVEVTFDVTE
jgi:hypothetical protein